MAVSLYLKSPVNSVMGMCHAPSLRNPSNTRDNNYTTTLFYFRGVLYIYRQ